MISFYSQEELSLIGLHSYGRNVQISRKCSIYNPQYIDIGDNVRIDDFSILSGKIKIGNHVHIAAYVALFAGQEGIMIGDFAGISSRTTVYAVSDDYSGEYMTNPTIKSECRGCYGGTVVISKHVLVGTSCTILPNIVIGEGASIGAMSLVVRNVEEWTINKGIPCKATKKRSKNLLEFESKYYGNSSV